MKRASLISVLLLVGVWGCVPAEMHPGDSCGSCHSAKAESKTRWGDAVAFGAAGTVYSSPNARARAGLAGATIDITDAAGDSVSLQANDVGNFYTTKNLTPPLQVTVSKSGATASMTNAPSGDCNSCHTSGAKEGRVHLPAAARGDALDRRAVR